MCPLRIAVLSALMACVSAYAIQISVHKPDRSSITDFTLRARLILALIHFCYVVKHCSNARCSLDVVCLDASSGGILRSCEFSQLPRKL
jgi:hypothetical protein